MNEEIVKLRVELLLYLDGPVDIIASYLYKVQENLVKNLGPQYRPVLLRILPITIPPIWSDAAHVVRWRQFEWRLKLYLFS